jgi:hypothetical protein
VVISVAVVALISDTIPRGGHTALVYLLQS